MRERGFWYSKQFAIKKTKDHINMLLEIQYQVKQDIFLQNFTKNSGWNFVAKLWTESWDKKNSHPAWPTLPCIGFPLPKEVMRPGRFSLTLPQMPIELRFYLIHTYIYIFYIIYYPKRKYLFLLSFNTITIASLLYFSSLPRWCQIHLIRDDKILPTHPTQVSPPKDGIPLIEPALPWPISIPIKNFTIKGKPPMRRRGEGES